MTHSAVVTFSSSKFVGDDFFVFALLNHFHCHFRVLDRRAMRDPIAISVHEHVRKHNLLARFGLEQIDIDRVALRDAMLPATGLDDCKSHTSNALWGKSRATWHRSAKVASPSRCSCRRLWRQSFSGLPLRTAAATKTDNQELAAPLTSSTISPFGGCA